MIKVKLWLLREQLRGLLSFHCDTTIFERRANYEKYVGRSPIADEVDIIDDLNAGHPARWLKPKSAISQKTIIYYHGGSMCMGSIHSHTPIASQIAKFTGCNVYLPEYRLAPEHPFPEAIDDAVASYDYILSQGINSNNVAICADSAGGLLALNVLINARDKGLPMPSSLAMLAPAVCLDLVPFDEFYKDLDNRDPVLSLVDMRRYTHAYLGTANATNPKASPLYNDLSNLPPIMSVVGSEEMIIEQVRQLHIKCYKDGTVSELFIQPGCFHAHYLLYALLPEGMQAIEKVSNFMTKHFNSHKGAS